MGFLVVWWWDSLLLLYSHSADFSVEFSISSTVIVVRVLYYYSKDLTSVKPENISLNACEVVYEFSISSTVIVVRNPTSKVLYSHSADFSVEFSITIQ